MTFKSAVDWWYYLVILIVVLSLWFSLLPQVQSGQLSLLHGGLVALLALGLPVWLLLATYYRVESGTLMIRSGPFSWRIPVSEISSAEPSRSVLSAPALSLKRIELTYSRGRKICVSPGDPQAFLESIGHGD